VADLTDVENAVGLVLAMVRKLDSKAAQSFVRV